MPRPFDSPFRRIPLAALLALAIAGLCPRASSAAPPKGEVTKHSFAKSTIFPGTTRDYWVYVPKQYDPAKPACLWVNQDGIQNKAPEVFDELIDKKEIPIMIGVFVTPGRARSTKGGGSLDRFNRSFEYDGLGDAYVRFLLEELLPEVETLSTTDGRAIHLSKDGNDRGIGGSSSGAICAFTAAWERPDSFHRVFSAIGTYVGLRGGNVYPTLIRKTEPKPLRVFLQDGSSDLNIYGGDWWMANQEMERALIFAGYEVNHDWGTGGHNGQHAGKIFPEAMRWLWKDWPEPVKSRVGSPMLRDLLVPGEGWTLVSEGHQFTEGPACNAKGEVYFNDIPASKGYKIGLDGKTTVFLQDTDKANGQAFGRDGRLFAVATKVDQVLVYDAEGRPSTYATGIRGNDLVVGFDGGMYITQPGRGGEPSLVWYVSPKGDARVVDKGLKSANGIALSPDQSLLYVADYSSHWVYSFQIAPDGSLLNKQRFYHLHAPDTAEDAGLDGMKVDRDGRLYVATRMGIQVCDQAGRVNAIIPTPNGKVANLCFGGEDLHTLFATCGDKVYKRKLKVQGVLPFQAPIMPAAPRL